MCHHASRFSSWGWGRTHQLFCRGLYCDHAAQRLLLSSFPSASGFLSVWRRTSRFARCLLHVDVDGSSWPGHCRSFHWPLEIASILCVLFYIPSIGVHIAFWVLPERFSSYFGLMRRKSTILRSDILCDENARKWGPPDTYAPYLPKTLATNLDEFAEKISDLALHIGGSSTSLLRTHGSGNLALSQVPTFPPVLRLAASYEEVPERDERRPTRVPAALRPR